MVDGATCLIPGMFRQNVLRKIRPDDIPTLKQLQQGFKWEFGPDFIGGLCAVDEHDTPVMFVGGWARAEVHIAVDSKWSTPGARLFLLKQLHEAMRYELKAKGFNQAVTWFDEARDRFKDRLQSWGWVKSKLISWHREL